MQFATLASSSSGNSALISQGRTNILIDAGISCRRILTALSYFDVDPRELDALLITHEHSDHVKGIATLLKKTDVELYAPEGVADVLIRQFDIPFGRLHPFEPGASFSVGDFDITTFPTPHDSADSTGYTVENGRRRIALVTDLGHITDAVQQAIYGADLIMLEANHDLDRLQKGPYPWHLKKRISGERGHLNNADSGRLAAESATGRTRQIILAHLSGENNTPRLAYEAVAAALEGAGAVLERDLHLEVAPRNDPSSLHTV